MCGIVGFTGEHQAAPILLDGLSKLEYRGYDSAGIAIRDGSADAEIIKAKGRLKVLAEKTNDGESVKGTCGIGHTRWATHGEPSENNAHPHASDDGNVVAVHNGIIENYQELKDKLVRKGYTFYSETDTEVAVKLIDYYYKKYEGTPVDAINHALVRIRGSYALAIMFRDYPEEIYVARKDSPMILGVANGESYIGSDVPAILKYTRDVYYIGNQEMARVRKGEITFYNLDGEEIEKELKTVEWDAEAAEKSGYEHFMIKEIHEQPKAVSDTLNSVIKDGMIDLSEVGLSEEEIKEISQIYIVACGSAYHVGMAAQYVIEDLARIPVRVELASEFRYRNPILDPKGLVVIISQSGETADSLAALREAKEKGIAFVPLSITFDNDTYKDGIEISRSEFYKRMREEDTFPKTAQPSPQAFLDVFEEAKANGDQIIGVMLSGGISGTYQSANIAKDMAEYDGIHLIDSKTAVYAIKIMVDYGMQLRDEGKTVDEIVEALEELKSRISINLAIDNLENLYKGGRLTKMQAGFGNFAKLKPVISIPEGTLIVKGKFIGRKKAIAGLVSYIEGMDLDERFPIYGIYSDGTENLDNFVKKVEEKGIKFKECYQIGPTIGTHVGPETFGFIAVEKAKN